MVRPHGVLTILKWAAASVWRVLLVLMVLQLGATAPGARALDASSDRAAAIATATGVPFWEAVAASHWQVDETEPGRLRTVGGTAPSLTGDSEQELRSQSGSLLAASDSAWNDLTRNERAILLDGWVRWVDYEDAIAAKPSRRALLAPVVVADELTGAALEPGDLAINEVVLALPDDKLGSALAEGETQSIAVGPDLLLLVDNVVVAQLPAAAHLVPDITTGDVDDRGLIVRPGSTSPAIDAEDPGATETGPPCQRSAAGESIPQVSPEELPPEAIDTLILILEGGPFPFERDGATFGNYEERLPDADYGAYREYTVITPGEDDRGARRIVTGEDDTTFYYTDDHYETFVEVILLPEGHSPACSNR